MTKLTPPQWETLTETERGGEIGLHCVSSYKPAQKLVDLGLARWRREDYLVITPAGLAALRAKEPQP